ILHVNFRTYAMLECAIHSGTVLLAFFVLSLAARQNRVPSGRTDKTVSTMLPRTLSVPALSLPKGRRAGEKAFERGATQVLLITGVTQLGGLEGKALQKTPLSAQVWRQSRHTWAEMKVLAGQRPRVPSGGPPLKRQLRKSY